MTIEDPNLYIVSMMMNVANEKMEMMKITPYLLVDWKTATVQ
jgi:hypothetical protein